MNFCVEQIPTDFEKLMVSQGGRLGGWRDEGGWDGWKCYKNYKLVTKFDEEKKLSI